MTGPTTSVFTTLNFGSPAFSIASMAPLAPCSRLNPFSASVTWGSRIMIWRAASSPYFWTTLSPGSTSSALRT